MQYLVDVEKGSSSYDAYVSVLPGCTAVGETRDNMTCLIQEAMEFHIDGLITDGQAVLLHASHSRLIEVAAELEI